MLFKLDLLTNAAVDDDAIRFVSSHKSKEKLKSSSEGHKEESNEPDYYEDEDHLEEARRGNWRNNNWNNKSSFLIMQFIRTTHP